MQDTYNHRKFSINKRIAWKYETNKENKKGENRK
jgi:hypothetical protein